MASPSQNFTISHKTWTSIEKLMDFSQHLPVTYISYLRGKHTFIKLVKELCDFGSHFIILGGEDVTRLLRGV